MAGENRKKRVPEREALRDGKPVLEEENGATGERRNPERREPVFDQGGNSGHDLAAHVAEGGGGVALVGVDVHAKTTERPAPVSTLTETIWPFETPNAAASAGVMWMWRFAIMHPSASSISPAGPTIRIPGVPATSPLSRTGTPLRPSARASVNESSTWQALRSGPSTLTASSPLGPTSFSFSLAQANWPGCDRAFLDSSFAPAP